MKIEGSTITFNSGRTRYANSGIVGIGPKDFSISEGYDGGFWQGFAEEDWRDYDDQLSADDLKELADYMIERWKAFKTHIESFSESRTCE